MPSPLPRTWELLQSSWDEFTKTWDTTVRISAWFILATIVQVVYVFLPLPSGMRNLVAFAGLGVSAALLLWTTLRLYRVTFALDAGEKVTPQLTNDVWPLALPLIIVGFLQGAILIAASLPALALVSYVGFPAIAIANFSPTGFSLTDSLFWGFIVVTDNASLLILFLALLLPAIYLSIRLGFSQLLVFKGKRGRAALEESWALTKDRFKPVLLRQAAVGLVFALSVGILGAIAASLVGVIAGPAFREMLRDPESVTGQGTIAIVSSIIQAALIPALVISQVKLLRMLERTR